MAVSKKVTIQQIAALANVSTATASRVLNQPLTVKQDTRERVFWAMRQLDYQPGQRHTPMILATFPTLVNPFYGPVIQGMQDAAKKRYLYFSCNYTDPPCSRDGYHRSPSKQAPTGHVLPVYGA